MKLLFQNPSSSSYCVKEKKPCVAWIEKYFKDCLCNIKDELSFGCGLVSLMCWGVAEIPQIITNFQTKSSHGVSLLFLLAWVAGDIFNLVGCLLEPATLPTQFYTALLYMTSTVLLVLQSIYYDYLYVCWKRKDIHSNQQIEEIKEPLKPTTTAASTHQSGIRIPNGLARRDFYYTSARSLAGSSTPPMRSHLWPVTTRSVPTVVELDNASSSEDEALQVPSKKFISQPKPIPRSAGYGALVVASASLPSQAEALMGIYAGYSGRKLLKEHNVENNEYGQLLGWMMAAIYMGGRIPQIWLNIKRRSVEGLNPLMFTFALIANTAYVGSILVRTTEWHKIKANLPWLLDAVVCVVLDLFIILQYVYYRCNQKSNDYGLY